MTVVVTVELEVGVAVVAAVDDVTAVVVTEADVVAGRVVDDDEVLATLLLAVVEAEPLPHHLHMQVVWL